MISEDMTHSLEIGTKFWQIYQGYTASGWGQVSKIWEVSSYKGNGIYTCKAISDNTVGRLAAGYTEDFHENKIKDLLIETPIIKVKKLNEAFIN